MLFLEVEYSFQHNLSDAEIESLQRLLISIGFVQLSSFIVDSRDWPLSPTSLFTMKSFYLALSMTPSITLFHPAKFLWSSKVPSKVKAFALLVGHRKVNTNDLLQLRRPNRSLNPHW